MEELLRRYKICVKKILQDFVNHGKKIDDSNVNAIDLLNVLEEIFKHGLRSHVNNSVVTFWNFLCQLSNIQGDSSIQGSAIEKEVLLNLILINSILREIGCEDKIT